jgi:hypothetical protein
MRAASLSSPALPHAAAEPLRRAGCRAAPPHRAVTVAVTAALPAALAPARLAAAARHAALGFAAAALISAAGARTHTLGHALFHTRNASPS